MDENIKNVFEYKSILSDSLKDVDKGKRTMVGQFADYRTHDLVGDLSHKGMFDRTWREAKGRVKHLYEHDTTKPIGKISELWDDDNGAYYKSSVPKHKFGDDVLEMAEAGLINEHSFGYVTKKATKNKKGGLDLFEVMHMEVTSVGGGYAIHGNTPLIALTKTLTEQGVDALIESMNAKYKALSNYCYKANASDETLEGMEQKMAILLIEIKQLQQMVIEANSTPVAEEAQVSQKGIDATELSALDLSIKTQLIKFSI